MHPRIALAVALLAGSPDLGAQASPPAASYRPGIDVLDYDLSIELADTGRAIAGRAVLTLTRAPSVDTLVLDLLRLRVDSVLVDGRPAPFRRTPERLHVALPRAGDTLRVAVRYGGAPADGLIVTPNVWGVSWVAFGDNWPDRARHWIPSVDHPSDKATVTWTVTAPANRRVVANGELREETPLPDGRTRTRWREALPITTYTMVIAVAPLALHDLGESACGLREAPGCVRQAVYVDPALHGRLPGAFARAGEIVEYFARLVAPFPYEKLAHLQSSTRFGGMENVGAIFYADRLFREQGVDEQLIAHETVHQWFGNAVTEREWGHLWLSEGFATYFAQLWAQHAHGDSVFRAGMAGLRERIAAGPVTFTRPVLDTAQTELLQLLNTNSYQKGGWVLHMLRGLVGDSAFFKGVRGYYAAHRHGTALTGDLVLAMERASGRELDWFFEQWLRRPGIPELSPCWRYDPRARSVLVRVAQGGRTAPYRFPLTVEFRAADGTRWRRTIDVDAAPVTQVRLTGADVRPPTAATFDPDVALLATFAGRAGEAAGRGVGPARACR